MATWFISDTHFGHANIIRYCARPFATVTEMDAALIATWNEAVAPDDEVWHLGDFCFRNPRAPSSYLSRLHGRKHLVWGNHDGEETRVAQGWASSQPIAEIAVGGVSVVLLHYAMRVWHRSHHGSLHLYGHSHGRLPGDTQSCDVGVDAWNYRPVGMPEILRRMRHQVPRVAKPHGSFA